MAVAANEQPGRPRRLVQLDGLRGVAAIFVMLYHLELAFGSGSIFTRSYLFVDFFFLLSGFVLTLAAEAGIGTDFSDFMRRRIARLWPVIAIGVMAGAAHQAMFGEESALALHVAMGLLMIPSQAGMLFPLNGPQWSLLHELLANIVHGLLLRRLDQRGLLVFAGASALLLTAVVVHFGSNTLGPFSFNGWFALPRVAFSYTFGVFIGRRWMARRHAPVVSWRTAFVLPPLALVVLPALPLDIALGDIVAVVAIFPMLLWFAATSEPPRQARKWLEALGAVSFPLYAIHLPIIETIVRLGTSWPIRLLAFAVTIAAAHFIALALANVAHRGRRARLAVPQPTHS